MMDLQFISHFTEQYSYLDSIQMALKGGCRWIQLRMKGATQDEIRPVALQALKMCRDCGATFIIDDHVELVRDLHADGVHLGKNDMPISEAREMLGADFIIGGTANTYDDVKAHHQAGADYIGCGPFRFTTTKQNLSPVLGVEGYRSIVNQMRSNNLTDRTGLPLPIVAIGGITAEDIPEILSTGIDGIALSGTILRADNPVKETQRLLQVISANKV